MKVIDLLNKIANGEKVPKKIKYKGSIYTYLEQEGNKIYQYEDYNAVLDIQCFENLNDEVEIIEEKKIPETIKTKIGYGGLTYLKDEDFSNGSIGFNHREDIIVSKINEIIDYLQSKGDE